MATNAADALIVTCPNCAAPNRVPREKMSSGGTCGRCRSQIFAAKPVTITDANFDAHASRSDIPLLVDVWVAWCGPCRQMAPAPEAAASKLEPWMCQGARRLEVTDRGAGNPVTPEGRYLVMRGRLWRNTAFRAHTHGR